MDGLLQRSDCVCCTIHVIALYCAGGASHGLCVESTVCVYLSVCVSFIMCMLVFVSPRTDCHGIRGIKGKRRTANYNQVRAWPD